jgi:hypothetical protein
MWFCTRSRSAPAPDAHVLGGGDLHVVDEVPVPDRLEQAVREAERQYVLDRLLPQVVVDAVDLRLVEHRQDLAVQLLRLGLPRAERLFDDDAHVGLVVLVEPVLAELLHDQAEEVRRGREVEDAAERDPGLLVELPKLLPEPVEDRVVVEGPRHVAHLLEQLLEHLLVRRAARVLLDRVARDPAVLIVRHVGSRDGDQVEALGERALVREVVDRGKELAVRQIPRGAEDHERGGMHREALEARDQRVLLLYDGHRATPRAAGSAPRRRRRPRRGLRTGSGARRSPWRRTRPPRAR